MGQSRANRQNREEAKRGRDFTERMSSTAHQREVKDLRLAGLNPILSAAKGASTPGANVATNQQSITKEGVNSALTARLQNAQLDKIDSETTNNGITKGILENAETNSAFDAKINEIKLKLLKKGLDNKPGLSSLYQEAIDATSAGMTNTASAYDAIQNYPKEALKRTWTKTKKAFSGDWGKTDKTRIKDTRKFKQ